MSHPEARMLFFVRASHLQQPRLIVTTLHTNKQAQYKRALSLFALIRKCLVRWYCDSPRVVPM